MDNKKKSFTDENVIDIEEARRALSGTTLIIRGSAIAVGVLLIGLGIILNFSAISDWLNSLFA